MINSFFIITKLAIYYKNNDLVLNLIAKKIYNSKMLFRTIAPYIFG